MMFINASKSDEKVNSFKFKKSLYVLIKLLLARFFTQMYKNIENKIVHRKRKKIRKGGE